MSNKIIMKRSAVPDKEPQVENLEYGELAINYADEKIYYKNLSNQIVEISGGSTFSVQEGFIRSFRTGGAPINEHGDEDASYYDVDLTQSPYVPVDPERSVAIFEGSFSDDANCMLGASYHQLNVTVRVIDSGNTLRISSPYSNSNSHEFIGRWRVVEM